MKLSKSLKMSVMLLSMGVFVLSIIQISCMRSDMMGKNNSMKEMMQQYMADQLPSPGLKPEHLPEPDSKSVKLLSKYCTQCHALPAPGLNAAQEWPAVVARMNRRMQMMANRSMMKNIEAPSNSEINILVSYLQKHAL